MEQLYRCSYCKEFTGSAEEVTEHEDRCRCNPKFENCFSCKFLTRQNGQFWCRKSNPAAFRGDKLGYEDRIYAKHDCHCLGQPRIIRGM